ncbi:hypothetical protein ACQ4PT_029373 [Festuca glaucescens]
MAVAATAGERLADDPVLEILARAYTDVATLFRCAVTCKRWRALVADLSFLRRRWPERESAPPVFPHGVLRSAATSNASTSSNPDELALVVVEEQNNVDVEDDAGTEDDIHVNADSDNVSDHHDKSASVDDEPVPVNVDFYDPANWATLGNKERDMFAPGLRNLRTGPVPSAVVWIGARLSTPFSRLLHPGLAIRRIGRCGAARRAPRPPPCARANDDPARLAVCNLLVGTCDVLPSLKRGVVSVNCAIVTGADCCSSNGHHQQSPLLPNYYSTFFMVLAIVIDDSKNHCREYNNLYTFSSVQPGWSDPTNCFDVVRRSDEHDLAILQWRNKVVVCGGVAHWLMLSMSKLYILHVSIETDDISITELLIPEKLHSTRRYIGGPTLFVTVTGSPSLFWMQEEGLLLDMWTPADAGAWLHTRTVELKPPKTWNPSLVHVWSGEKSGVLLIIDTFRCVHMVDVESGVMEDVSDQFRSSWGMMAIPMEIDWPALFMSRLGGE